MPDLPPNGVKIVRLERIPRVEVVAETDDRIPMIVCFPYGMGSIALLAVDVKSEPLASWKGRHKLWRKVVERFAPAITPDDGTLVGAIERELSK